MTKAINRPYAPSAYRATDQQALDLIKSYPFAVIVTANDGIEATHTPVYFETGKTDCTVMIGHIARANSQTTDLLKSAEALAIFNGPSAYISPSWYVENEDVPTWIYQAVHVRGKIRPVVDDAEMRELMENLIQQSENRSGTNWQLNRISEDDIARMMPRIIGFKIDIESITGVNKMEQGHSAANRNNVASKLQQGCEIGKEALAEHLKNQ